MGFELAIAALAALGFAGLTLWRTRANEARIIAANPPNGQLVAVAGGVVHVRQTGAGRDLVLIHGVLSNLNDFPPALLQSLARDFRVTLMDRPGLGHSTPLGAGAAPEAQAAALAEAAATLGLRDPVVLGHSYGATVALAWALAGAAAPVRPAALVLVSGAVMPARLGLHAAFAMLAARFGRAVLTPLSAAWTPRMALHHVIATTFSPQHAPAGYINDIGARLVLRRASFRANADQITTMPAALERLAPGYSTLTLPIEIVTGTADAVVPHEVHSVALAARLPAARLTLLPGIGHMPQYAAPEALVAAAMRAAALVLPA